MDLTTTAFRQLHGRLRRCRRDAGRSGAWPPAILGPVVLLAITIGLILLAGLITFSCGRAPASTTSVPAASTTTTAGDQGPTSTLASTPVPSSTLDSQPAPADKLVGPYDEPEYLDPQPVDLAEVINIDKAALSDTQKRILARQSFVAVSAPPGEQPWKFWQVYESARYQGLPLLVTTDSVLNAYHGLFDTLLQRLEEEALYKQAEIMTEALYAAASNQWNMATDPTVQEDARLNMAYFSVANSLLKGAIAAPDAVRNEVQTEVALIEAAGRLEKSPILGYKEDYSQYKPRGHYTRSERLKRYFKAMMWYGHTAFYINPRSDVPEELAQSLTRRAALIASSLTGSAKEAWSAIYYPTSFLVGRADDLTVDDVRKVVAQVFSSEQPAPDALADAAKIPTLRKELNKLPPPKILTAAGQTGDPEIREGNERSFRVMGQRYIPDSYAFQQLVWANVGEEPDKKRDLPMGLDIMTVLGSDQAYRIEKQDLAQDEYLNWESQIKKVHEEFTGREPDLWPANLYSGWLESLQEVMALPPAGAPDFMKSRVWARKSLNTALGSWTELRHDTILYAKQSVTAEGEGGEEPQTPGYVEPYPAFYAKIAELAGTLRKGLVDYGLIDPDSANKLEAMISLAQTLQSIAEKELTGQTLLPTEKATIATYGSQLEYLEQFKDNMEGRTLSPTAEKSPLVADVHTSYNSGRALEEATGYPLILYAAFEVDGQLRLLAGASYAYYEFTVPLASRLTDEEWTGLLDTGGAPSRPAWTDAWIVEK